MTSKITQDTKPPNGNQTVANKSDNELNGNSNCNLRYLSKSTSIDSISSSDEASDARQSDHIVSHSSRYQHGKQEYENKTLFVGDLPLSFGQKELGDLLEEAGEQGSNIVSAKVIKSTKATNCYAFVKFKYRRVADEVLNKLKNLPSSIADQLGPSFRPNWAKCNTCLHVRNLDPSMSTAELHALFQEYGAQSISQTRIDRLGNYCSVDVKFSSVNTATYAKLRLNQKDMNGKLLRVDWMRGGQIRTEESMLAQENASRAATEDDTIDSCTINPDPQPSILVDEGLCPDGAASGTTGSESVESAEDLPSDSAVHDGANNGHSEPSCEDNPSPPEEESTSGQYYMHYDRGDNYLLHCQPGPVISVYVQFETVNPTARISEHLMKCLFEKFGVVVGCFIKSSFLSTNGKRQHGYGFVHFESNTGGQEAARRAVATIGNGSDRSPLFVQGGIAYRCEVSKNYRRSTALMHEKFHSPYSYMLRNTDLACNADYVKVGEPSPYFPYYSPSHPAPFAVGCIPDPSPRCFGFIPSYYAQPIPYQNVVGFEQSPREMSNGAHDNSSRYSYSTSSTANDQGNSRVPANATVYAPLSPAYLQPAHAMEQCSQDANCSPQQFYYASNGMLVNASIRDHSLPSQGQYVESFKDGVEGAKYCWSPYQTQYYPNGVCFPSEYQMPVYVQACSYAFAPRFPSAACDYGSLSSGPEVSTGFSKDESVVASEEQPHSAN